MLTLTAVLMIAKTSLFAPKVSVEPAPQVQIVETTGECVGMRIVSTGTPILPRTP